MNIAKNPLLDQKVIKQRLRILKEAWASLSIEDMHLTPEEKTFLEKMVRQGLSEDEITQKINEKFING